MFEFFKKNDLVMAFSSFNLVSSLGIFLIVPFLSLILLEKGFTTAQITYFFAIYSLGIFLFSPIIGRISDEIGKKKVIFFGLIFEFLFLLSYFFIDTFEVLIVLRFLEAIAFSSIFFVLLSAFQDMITEKRGFWTGIYMSLGTIGAVLGPIIAGYISGLSSSKILLLVGAGVLIFSFIFLFFIPEQKPKTKKKKVTKSDFNIFSEFCTFLKFRELRGMAILGILMNSKNEIYLIFFPILITSVMGFSNEVLGFLLVVPIVSKIFQFYFGKIADNISSEFGVMLGVFLSCVAIIFLPLIDSLVGLVILLFFYGMGHAIWNVNAWGLMGDVGKKYDIEGEIIGSYVSIAKLGVFFSTLAAAFLVSIFGIGGALQFFGFVILFSLVVVYFFFKPIFHHESKKSYFHRVVNKKSKN